MVVLHCPLYWPELYSVKIQHTPVNISLLFQIGQGWNYWIIKSYMRSFHDLIVHSLMNLACCSLLSAGAPKERDTSNCACVCCFRSNQEIQTYAIALINALFLKAPEDRRQVYKHKHAHINTWGLFTRRISAICYSHSVPPSPRPFSVLSAFLFIYKVKCFLQLWLWQIQDCDSESQTKDSCS